MNWAFVLLGLALALALLDLFIPSHGLLILSAAACAAVAIALGFSIGFREGALLVAIVGVLTPIVAFAMIHWWPHTPIGRRVMLTQPEDPTELLPTEDEEITALVGRVGRAKTDLLPNGYVTVGQRNYDAITDGKAIDAGSPIKVVAVHQGRLLVRPATAEDLAAASETGDESTLLSQPVEDWGLDEDLDIGRSA